MFEFNFGGGGQNAFDPLRVAQTAEMIKLGQLRQAQIAEQQAERRGIAQHGEGALAGNPAARSALMRAAPGSALQFQDAYAKADERARAKASHAAELLARAADYGDTPEKWAQAVDIVAKDYPELAQYRDKFQARDWAIQRIRSISDITGDKTIAAPPGTTILDKKTMQPVFTAPDRRGESEVAKLMRERDALPAGDPRRATYGAAINKATRDGETAPLFQDMPLEGDRVQKLVSYDKGRTFQPFGAPYDRRDPIMLQNVTNPDTSVTTYAIPRAELRLPGQAPAAAPTGALAGAPVAPQPPTPGAVAVSTAPPKPISSEAAKTIGLVTSGLRGAEQIEKLVFDKKGDIRRGMLAVSSLPSWANFVSEDARMLATAAYAAADAELRLKTGAQAPQAEIERSARALMPNATDSNASARAKIATLKQYLESIRTELQPGKPASGAPSPQSGGAPGAAADSLEGRTATGPGGQKAIMRGGQWVPFDER